MIWWQWRDVHVIRCRSVHMIRCLCFTQDLCIWFAVFVSLKICALHTSKWMCQVYSLRIHQVNSLWSHFTEDLSGFTWNSLHRRSVHCTDLSECAKCILFASAKWIHLKSTSQEICALLSECAQGIHSAFTKGFTCLAYTKYFTCNSLHRRSVHC